MSEEMRSRTECSRCGQWFSYGSVDIGPCKDSDWKGVGRRDPLHQWQKVMRPVEKATKPDDDATLRAFVERARTAKEVCITQPMLGLVRDALVELDEIRKLISDEYDGTSPRLAISTILNDLSETTKALTAATDKLRAARDAVSDMRDAVEMNNVEYDENFEAALDIAEEVLA